MPLIKFKRNNINIDTDTTVLSQGEPFWSYHKGGSILLIGDGSTQIKDLPRYKPGEGGNADTVDSYHIIKLTEQEYDALPNKDPKTVYFVS